MLQFFKFIEKYRYFLLFLLLQFIALFFTIQSHSYHRSKFINSANSITGGIYSKTALISDFFNLKIENKHLLEENTRLKNLLSLNSYNIDATNSTIDTLKYFQRFSYMIGKIHKNEYTKQNNYLLINKGSKNSITSEMGVVNSRGIIGVTNNVSKNYATVISILNKTSRINAKLKNNHHFGTLSWDGEDYKIVQLDDLPRQAEIKIGDTIITGGKSTIFPEGILIGIVKDFKANNNSFQSINILLFNDMSSLSNVNIITNLHKKEIQELEATNQ